MRKFFLFVLTLIASIGLLSACDEADVEKVDNEEENTEQNDEDKEEKLSIGDTVMFDDLKITLNEVRIEEGGEFDEPEEDQFIVANLTIENEGDDEENISSIMNIELKDDEGYSYTTTILTEGTKGQLDGAIEPGGKMKGEIPFDVPESDSYELHFADPFASGKAVWDIPNDALE
ncbi:MAG TPA: DUF4352 domain-containing protein [Bacillota bacterium]|nr:DUF4352 domain-containing protein [Bacillota bacterium]